MAILIDGYNLLHASGILSRNIGPGTLERAREGLVGLLAAALDAAEREGTTVVFDARGAPGGLPRRQVNAGITILYAAGYEKADQLIIELIEADTAPRRLLVVSGDREIQRAARRRRATAVESSRWYEALLARRRPRVRNASAEKPAEPATDEEVRYWLDLFEGGGESPTAAGPSGRAAATDQPPPARPVEEKPVGGYEGFDDIFPPGYGEDLLEGEDW